MRASRLGIILWLVAAAVLVHGIARELGDDGLVGSGLVGGLLTAANSILGTGALAVRAANVLLLGALLGGLPLLAGILSRPLGKGLAAVAGGAVLTAAACVVVTLALDPLLSWATEDPDSWLAGAAAWLHPALLLLVGIVALCAGGCAGRLRTLIGVEWLKIRRGRLLRTGLCVAAAATLLAAWTHTPMESESGWTMAAHAVGVGFWAAEILALVLGAAMVAGEISQNTMKMILPHAYRRAEWIAAKAAVLVLCALLFAVVVSVVGVGITAWKADLGDVTRASVAGFGGDETVDVFQTAGVMRGRLLATIAAAAASLIASALVGLFLSCVFQSLVPALSASFLVFAALKTGDIFLGFTQKTLAVIYAHYPDELRRLTANFGRALNESWNDGLMATGLKLSMLTATLALLISLRVFGRRDLHG